MGAVAGFACFRCFLALRPAIQAQAAIVLVVPLAPPRRLRGSMVLHRPRPSSRWGALFHRPGLTRRSSGLAYGHPLSLYVSPMQFGPRLMRRRPPFGEPSESVDSLRTVLLSAPGVSAIKSIDLHHKGGFVAVIDFDRSSFDEFTNHIEAEGWMSVF